MKLKRWLNKEKISAMNDEELKKLLIKFKLIDNYAKNQLNCDICKKNITFNDISVVMLDKTNLKIICNDDNCLKKIGG